MLKDKKILKYRVVEDGILENAPCCCWQCTDEGLQIGHKFCYNVPDDLIELEKNGIITRYYSSKWIWKVVDNATMNISKFVNNDQNKPTLGKDAW